MTQRKTTTTATTRPQTGAKSAANAVIAPLLRDIRLLGKLLGDVIREQEGQATFELIEKIRQLAVAYRGRKDAQAGKALDRLLNNLSADQSVSVIRAFSYFSHLANLAEDRHQVRQASQAGARPATGSIPAA
ncbi:phosphoenolpyruvate carboxylase, partial [Aquabacterium sp. UBA2148]|uniref:phosphoenolpyruvate carboxylase n=1 Tax=Aquabacterium sp. UBA2148 TaxID=1946042 RepID=UPI00257A43F6